MPPQIRALFPSARALAMLLYVRSGCPVVVSVNVCASCENWLRSTAAAAPFWPGWPAGYSGCDGVLTSGSQLKSEVVLGLPSALKSAAYVALSSARGGAGLNWLLLVRTNIEVNANPWALIGPEAGSVGRHCPTAVPPVNAG